jgi:CHAT domain-containing protein
MADTALVSREQLLRLKVLQLVQQHNDAERTAQSKNQLDAELRATQKQYAELLQRMKLGNPAYATVINVEPPSPSEIQSVLDDKTCVLEYWVSDRALVVWIVSKSRIDVTVIPVTREELIRQVRFVRSSISLRLREESMKGLTYLYSKLITPVEAKLKSYTNLVIIPHQGLHFLPYQALLSQSGRYLIEDYVIEYAPASSIFFHCTKKVPAPGKKFLGVALGDAVIGDHSSLPGTELEVSQLSKLYSDFSSMIESEMTETQFKKETTGYNYVHIATHGVFNIHQPLYSYLLMQPGGNDDGRLTVNEIFGLDISSKIVTLSACETGLGDLSKGDELVGLSRAFIYAGSPGVIVSLWNVDDATTAWLMTSFHQYLSGGNTANESITFAQRDLINLNFTASRARGMVEVDLQPEITKAIKQKTSKMARNPYFWAPFILIGNGFIN